MYVNGITCFVVYLYKYLLLFWGSFQSPCSCFPWNKWFKRSPYFFSFCLQNNGAMLLPKFRNGPLQYHEGLIYVLNFLTIFSFWYTFHLRIFSNTILMFYVFKNSLYKMRTRGLFESSLVRTKPQSSLNLYQQ